jgi:DNA invertase Pin-like site-specific DNA recombinase
VLDRQLDALNDAGCVKIFTDQGVSGVRAVRPGLTEALAYLRPGDRLAVTSLDRLGRRTTDLLALVEDLDARGIGLNVLSLGMDTSTPGGRLILTVLAALSQMERDLLAERTKEGLEAARARGRVGGRPAALTPEQVAHVREQVAAGKPQAEVARILGVSARTVRRAVAGQRAYA